MVDYLIDFNAMDWENTRPGIRQKSFQKDGQRIRLIEFSDSFAETEIPEGELNRHKGTIIKGEKAIIILFEK